MTTCLAGSHEIETFSGKKVYSRREIPNNFGLSCSDFLGRHSPTSHKATPVLPFMRLKIAVFGGTTLA